MTESKSYLKCLVNQAINEVDIGINTVISLKEKKEDKSEQRMSVFTQISFDAYKLDIYNKAQIFGGLNLSAKDLVGLKVIDANETDESAELVFENGYKFIIDLGSEGNGSDPEAMCLQGPNNLIVVWD